MATKESAMRRAMALLKLAADERTPAAERELAAQQAENIMAQHMIDRMDLKPEERAKPVKDSWTIDLGDAESQFRVAIRTLVCAILRHNNIKWYPTIAWAKNDNGYTNFNMEIWTIVGFPEDIAYAEAIWFRVFREFVMNVSPKWDPSMSLGYNAYHFTRAGHKWRDIWHMAFNNGHKIAEPGTVEYIPSTLKREVRKYMEENNLGEYEAHTQSHAKYRDNFASAFASQIGYRLNRMRVEAGKVTDADKYALAVRSTAEYVEDEFDKLFPDVKAMLAEWAAKPQSTRKRRMKINNNYNEAAWSRGTEAANAVNLKLDAEVRTNKTKELQ